LRVIRQFAERVRPITGGGREFACLSFDSTAELFGVDDGWTGGVRRGTVRGLSRNCAKAKGELRTRAQNLE
jgi:hypothetical protein